MSWINTAISGGARVISSLLGGDETEELEAQLSKEQKRREYLESQLSYTQSELEETQENTQLYLLGIGAVLLVILTRR